MNRELVRVQHALRCLTAAFHFVDRLRSDALAHALPGVETLLVGDASLVSTCVALPDIERRIVCTTHIFVDHGAIQRISGCPRDSTQRTNVVSACYSHKCWMSNSAFHLIAKPLLLFRALEHVRRHVLGRDPLLLHA